MVKVILVIIWLVSSQIHWLLPSTSVTWIQFNQFTWHIWWGIIVNFFVPIRFFGYRVWVNILTTYFVFVFLFFLLDMNLYVPQWEIPHSNDVLLHGLLNKQHFSGGDEKNNNKRNWNWRQKKKIQKSWVLSTSVCIKESKNSMEEKNNIDVPHTLE